MPERRHSMLDALSEWAVGRRSRRRTDPGAPGVPPRIVERVVLEDAQILFTSQDGRWMTVDLVVGSGWALLQGKECQLPWGQPVTVLLEIEPNASRRVVAERTELLSVWRDASTRLQVEITKFLEGPGWTRIVMAGGGRNLDVSLTC